MTNNTSIGEIVFLYKLAGQKDIVIRASIKSSYKYVQINFTLAQRIDYVNNGKLYKIYKNKEG